MAHPSIFIVKAPVWNDLIVELGIVLHYVFVYRVFIFADDGMNNVIGFFIGYDEGGAHSFNRRCRLWLLVPLGGAVLVRKLLGGCSFRRCIFERRVQPRLLLCRRLDTSLCFRRRGR